MYWYFNLTSLSICLNAWQKYPIEGQNVDVTNLHHFQKMCKLFFYEMKLASCSSFIVVNMVKGSGCIMEPKNPIKDLHLMNIVPFIIFSNAKETDSGQTLEDYDEQKTKWFLSFGGLDFYLDSLHIYLEQTCDLF